MIISRKKRSGLQRPISDSVDDLLKAVAYYQQNSKKPSLPWFPGSLIFFPEISTMNQSTQEQLKTKEVNIL